MYLNSKSWLCITFLLIETLTKLLWIADVANPGARYPINDIYDGKENANLQGQLNSIGMRQQYLLGTYLRSDYIEKEELISRTYNPKSIEVFACSNTDRTYDSALSRLYGLFPAGTGWRIPSESPKERWEPPFESNYSYTGMRSNDLPFGLELGFQPIPIYPLDNILDDACNNSGIIKSKRLQEVAKTLVTFEAQQSIFISKMKLVFNLSALQISLVSMADLYDTILSDITLGKDLPSSFDEDYDMRSLKYISDYYNILIFDSTYAKVLSTLLLITIKDKMDLIKSHNFGDKKWSMFFAKELSVYPLMTVLNLTSTDCLTQQYKNETLTSLNCVSPPSFSANLIFELHEDDSFRHEVRIKYNGAYVNLCEKKETSCEYRNFWNRFNLDLASYQESCYGK